MPALHKSLGFVSAVDFNVYLGIVFFLFPLFVKCSAEAQQVKGQQKSHHAEHKETHIHLK